MKKTVYFIPVLIFVLFTNSFSQKPVIEFSFTATHYGQHLLLDSIYVENLTQGGDTMLYAPDTTLVLEYVAGIFNYGLAENNFFVSQNYPNPFNSQTSFDIDLHVKDNIKIAIYDILGKKVGSFKSNLNPGIHSFTFLPGNEKYSFLAVTFMSETKTIKMLNTNSSVKGYNCKIKYNGIISEPSIYKLQSSVTTFEFSLGDQLRYIGYSKTLEEINGSDIIDDTPQNNKTYEFGIIEGVPCPGIPIVNYEGHDYKTVQIAEQCWFKENLNIGTMINGNEEQTDNSIIEKYCYENDEANCDTYGGLYQWDEMMQYVTDTAAQGICPEGWHISSHSEWKYLEGTVDSLYGVGDTIWDENGFRGFDAGKNLKSFNGWNNNGNGTNTYGFTALPGGKREEGGTFNNIGTYADIWTSTMCGTYYSHIRSLSTYSDDIALWNIIKERGHSARCIKD